ncbi:hypothetical protein TeGR_g6018 [Tetraparma gracilis]|uniref:Uncharacterized protein n=1 Tax=Tetraparma gracilis TaxID=2962635 RepID=A0ABQ6NEQ4_9STRA|nr:hypothetical protein TeGR_g6018 [Tetraparma gracilis]
MEPLPVAPDEFALDAPPSSVQAMLNLALAELKAKAAEADELRTEAEELRAKAAVDDAFRAKAAEDAAKAADADDLRSKLEESEAELLQLRKQHEQVRHEDTLFHKMKTTTSKTKMEKLGSTLVHVNPEQLRTLFMKLLDKVLLSPPSAAAPPPDAIVHAVSETSAAVLMYRNLAVRNMGGMTSTELFEFHLHVSEDPEDPNLITFRALSDDDAKRLCGGPYVGQVVAKRNKVAKPKRVQVDGKITLEAADFDCTKLIIAASVLLTSGVDRAAASSASSPTLLPRQRSASVARGDMLKCSPEVAEAVLSFLTGAARSLHDRFARYKEVDKATLRHFVEHVMDEAPESSEKEKALILRRLRDDNDDNRSWSRLAGTVWEPVSYFKKVDEDSNTWGKGKGVVDASAPDVLAWLWLSCTHERNLRHMRKDGNLLKMEQGVPGTRSKFMVASSKMPGAISNRVFANWWTWAKEQNCDLVAAFTPHEEYGPGAEKELVDAALEATKDSVVAKLRGFFRIKTLAPNVCRVTVALAMAKATLDCSAKEAIASYFAVCGREKMRIGREVGDRARLIFKEHTAHDFEWTTVKKMPFPLTNREFLNRFLSFKEPTGDLVVVFEALPDSTKVDYGANLKVVRGKTTGVVRFKPINNDTQCEVTNVQHGDAGGFVPKRVADAKIPQALSPMCEMRELFQRDDAIDGAKRSELAAIVKSNNEIYTDAENAIVDRVRDQLDSIPDSSFEKLESPDLFVRMEAFTKGGKNGIPRGSTVLDEDICTCAAWSHGHVMSRNFAKVFYEGGGVEYAVTVHNDHFFTGQQVRDFNIPTFSPREFMTRSVWRWESDTMLLAVTESCLADKHSIRPGIVRASVLTLEKFERLDPLGEIPQTRITSKQQPDMGGFIPSRAVRGAAVGQMMYLSTMRKQFDRSLELDGKKREELVKMIRRHGWDGVEYSGEEEEILAEGKTWFKAFDGLKSKNVVMRSPQTKGKVAYKKGDSRAWGWCTATVRASPEEVLAHVWDTKARNKARPDDLEKEIDEKPNDHNQLVFNKKQTPAVIANRDFLGRAVWKKEGTVSGIQEYFAQLREFGEHDKADGRALGYRLTYPDEKNKKTPSKAVAHIVKLHKGLSQLSQEYPWIVGFLEEILLGGLHRNKAVPAKLDCLSEAEARRIGKNLPQALRSRKTADAGILQWQNQNPSMAELFEKYPWVEEMVLTMGEELLKNAAWGLWFRVITGSVGSMVDLATDINVIRVYFGEEGQEGYGWMMLGMVLASMGLQLGMVLVQNGKAGWGKLLQEVLIVVSGLKPGCILQVTALIQGRTRDQMGTKVFSIVVSAITTGMNSASISYDFDSDPAQRRKLPSFYGYLPDDGNKRTIMYVCMVLNSALLLLLRSIGVALLMLADTKIFVAYMVGDHLLYLLQKLVRGDFLHWLPIEGMGGVAWALLMRVIVKTLTDFTGIIQLRGPGEMGGAAWLWTMFLALVAPWGAVPVYFGTLASNSTNSTAVEIVLDITNSTTDALELEESDAWEPKEADAWRLLGGLSAGWVFAFGVFLSLMKKKYRSTFWSMETGTEWIQSVIVLGENDAIKQEIFDFNPAKWKAIAPQVKEWAGEGWTGWERDKPDWFTDNWKSRVPADWVPTEGKEEWKASVRRRSISVAERKGSVVYESAKQMTEVIGGDVAPRREVLGKGRVYIAN